MAKNVKETEKFLVGWGTKGKRIAFFISHKELPDTMKSPIPCDPENLEAKMVELARKVDEIRGKS
jgi:hypothetical protein